MKEFIKPVDPMEKKPTEITKFIVSTPEIEGAEFRKVLKSYGKVLEMTGVSQGEVERVCQGIALQYGIETPEQRARHLDILMGITGTNIPKIEPEPND